MTSALARWALVVVAVLIGGWLALGYRADRLEKQGWEAFRQPGEPLAQKIERAEGFLHRARRFNADPSPLVRESLLLVYTGHRARARVMARRVVAQEPDNLDGWRLVYLLAPDRATAAQARRKVQALDPWAADALR